MPEVSRGVSFLTGQTAAGQFNQQKPSESTSPNRLEPQESISGAACLPIHYQSTTPTPQPPGTHPGAPPGPLPPLAVSLANLFTHFPSTRYSTHTHGPPAPPPRAPSPALDDIKGCIEAGGKDAHPRPHHQLAPRSGPGVGQGRHHLVQLSGGAVVDACGRGAPGAMGGGVRGRRGGGGSLRAGGSMGSRTQRGFQYGRYGRGKKGQVAQQCKQLVAQQQSV